MRKRNILIIAATFFLTACGLYDKYEQQVEAPAETFGTIQDATAGGASLAEMSWREFFTDPLLQQLIEQVLANNTDLNSARIAVEKSEASLRMAKMAYLPSLYFSPQGTLSKFDDNPWTKTYNLPLQLSMDVDLFGSITNKKRASQAVLLQAQLGEEAVRSNLVSAVAQQYYLLQLLDQQLAILTMTDSLWNTSLETQKILWENGKSYSTSVNQMESSYLNVKTSIVDTRRNIRKVENAICSLLAITPQHIERSHLGTYTLPQQFKTGVPAMLLQYRPDIKLADYAMAAAYYDTQAARAAFYPSISLQGLAGWTNDAGGAIVNPGKILLNAMASLTQPIYAQGKLKANLKINQLAQEDMMNKYVQTVIDAGNEVNEALAWANLEGSRQLYLRI